MANLWLERNGLKLNSSKTKSMLIPSNRKSNSEVKLMIDGTEVEQIRCFKFLGVLVNDSLTWLDHVNLICTKVTRSLSLLRHLSWSLPQSLLHHHSSNHTSSRLLTTVMLSGLAAQKMKLFYSKLFKTLLVELSSISIWITLLPLLASN